MDARSGYWAIQLTTKSSLLTTFYTTFGRYHFLRLPFGIISAQDIFQRKIDETYEGLNGVAAIVDDILVFGRTKEEHDENLRAMLERTRERGVRLNPEKCVIGATEVSYFGRKLTREGIQPDPKKLQAIKDMPPPENKNELETILGMANYLSRFAPRLSEVNAPLRQLLKQDSEFIWDQNHDRVFHQMKDLITREPGPILAYYDTTKELRLQKSHRRVGPQAVGAHTEEANLVAPARLQRMLLQLQRYDIEIVHRPGKDIPVADTLSRKPLLNQDSTLSEGMEDQVHSVINSLPVSNKKLSEIQAATGCDPQLTLLKQTVHDGWPEDRKKCPKTLLDFWNFRDEISHFHGIIFKGDKIIVPTALRNNMLERIHTGHMGIERSKQRARDALFWPGMGKDIATTVENCSICQERCAANPIEPLIPHQIPERPWQAVASDLFTWRGRDYLVVVDYYSRYFEVERLFSTTAGSVIKKLKAIFARHGIPEKLISDNGPQYSSREFKDFAVTWDFVHTTSSPLYPQSNGLAKRTVKTAKSVLDKAHAQGVDPYLSLLEQRNTPLLMSRRLRSVLPITGYQLVPRIISQTVVQKTRMERQEHQRRYYNRSAAPLPRLQQGDHIRFQHESGSWKPAVIIRPAETARSFVIRTGEGQTIRRNRWHLRGAKASPAPSAPTSDLVTQPDSAAQQQAEPLSPSRDTKTPAMDTSLALTTRSGRVAKPRVILDL
ncbi:unnamed protein product [Oreochromis niloticus]|nr:unnamed protein product [Mustela putorius furo]